MTRVFYQGAHACIIVFDRTDADPFEVARGKGIGFEEKGKKRAKE